MAKIDPERDARLAAALRDNLKRRKAQARAGAISGQQSRARPEEPSNEVETAFRTTVIRDGPSPGPIPARDER